MKDIVSHFQFIFAFTFSIVYLVHRDICCTVRIEWFTFSLIITKLTVKEHCRQQRCYKILPLLLLSYYHSNECFRTSYFRYSSYQVCSVSIALAYWGHLLAWSSRVQINLEALRIYYFPGFISLLCLIIVLYILVFFPLLTFSKEDVMLTGFISISPLFGVF